MNEQDTQRQVKNRRVARSAAMRNMRESESIIEARIIELRRLGTKLGYRPKKSSRKIPTVPWLIQWTDEVSYDVRPCRWAGGRMSLWQPSRPGCGKPDFKEQHVVRQRRAIIEGLCSVCGERVDEGGVLWISALGSVNDDGWFTLFNPLLHFDCLEETVRSCPYASTGLVEFAPYKGIIRKVYMMATAAQAQEWHGVTVHHDTRIITVAKLQIPVAEMEKLQRIAV